MVWSVQNSHQISAVKEIETSRSSRVVAILGGAIVEQRLEIALKRRLRPETNADRDIHEKMFNPSGPLGPLANKIDLGYLMGMYDLRTKNALSAIATIRNHFAHRLSQSFSSPDKQFAKAVSRLVLHDGLKLYPNPFMKGVDTDEKIRRPTNNKQLFLVNVKLALILLMRDGL